MPLQNLDSNTSQNATDLVPDSVLQTWAQKVATNPTYTQMSSEEQTDAKDAFFKKYVAPSVHDDNVAPAYMAFDFATSSPKDVYTNSHFQDASEDTKRSILRKNLIANGQDPDAVVKSASQATNMGDPDTVPMDVPAVTAADQAYQQYQSDPETHSRGRQAVANEVLSPLTGLAQLGAVVNPFVGKDQEQKILNSAKATIDTKAEGEKEFPDVKPLGYAAQAAPILATGGVAGGVEGLTGIAARSAVAGAVTGATTSSNSVNPNDIVNDKLTTGAIAAGANGLLETLAIPLKSAAESAVLKFAPNSGAAAINAKAAQKAVQSAAVDLAKINGTTPEQELAIESQRLVKVAAGDLTATNSDLMDLATKKLTNKASLTQKQQDQLTAAIQTKLGSTAAQGSSSSVAQDVSDNAASAATARDASLQGQISDVDKQAYGVPTGTPTANAALLQKTNQKIADFKATNKANYTAEIAPTENAVGTHTASTVQEALDNATLADGTPLSKSPDLADTGKSTLAYKTNGKYVPEETPPAEATPNPEYTQLEKQFGAGAPKIAEAAGIKPTIAPTVEAPAEEAPVSLGYVNRRLDDIESQLSPQFQKANPGTRADVLQAQKEALLGVKKDILDANPDVAAQIGKADEAFAQGKNQFFQSGEDLGTAKPQNSVLKGIYDKAQNGTLSSSDLDAIFESDNHAQTLVDFKKAVGNDPETEGQIGDAFHNWLQNKLPDGTAEQKVAALDKLLSPKGNNDFVGLAKQIPTGEGRTAFDDLTDARASIAQDAQKVADLKSNIGIVAKDSPYISLLTKNKQSSDSINNLIKEPETLADAGRHFGQPGYGKTLQAGSQVDVLTDMQSLASDPKKLLAKYSSPEGKKVLDVVFQGNSQDRQLIDSALADAQKFSDIGNISKFSKGNEPISDAAKALGHGIVPGKTSVVTKVFSAIETRATRIQQEQLQKVLTDAQYAKAVTDKVSMGMSTKEAVDNAYNTYVRPNFVPAAVAGSQQNAQSGNTTRSLLDTPVKSQVLTSPDKPATIDVGPQSSNKATPAPEHPAITAFGNTDGQNLIDAHPHVKAYRLVSQDTLKNDPEAFFNTVTKNNKTKKLTLSDPKTVAQVLHETQETAA